MATLVLLAGQNEHCVAAASLNKPGGHDRQTVPEGLYDPAVHATHDVPETANPFEQVHAGEPGELVLLDGHSVQLAAPSPL